MNDNVRVDVSSANDVGWDVLNARVLLLNGLMVMMVGHDLSIYGLLGLWVPGCGWDLAS